VRTWHHWPPERTTHPSPTPARAPQHKECAPRRKLHAIAGSRGPQQLWQSERPAADSCYLSQEPIVFWPQIALVHVDVSPVHPKGSFQLSKATTTAHQGVSIGTRFVWASISRVHPEVNQPTHRSLRALRRNVHLEGRKIHPPGGPIRTFKEDARTPKDAGTHSKGRLLAPQHKRRARKLLWCRGNQPSDVNQTLFDLFT
jgi:hypothetical protein